MKKMIAELLTSKKALMAIAGAIAAGVGRLGLDLPVEDIAAILGPIIAFIFSQGIADAGKEKAKIERGG